MRTHSLYTFSPYSHPYPLAPTPPSLRAAGKTQRGEVCNWCDKAGNILLFKRQHNKLEAQLRKGEKKKIPQPQEQVLSAAAVFSASVQLRVVFRTQAKKNDNRACLSPPPSQTANDQTVTYWEATKHVCFNFRCAAVILFGRSDISAFAKHNSLCLKFPKAWIPQQPLHTVGRPYELNW